MFKATQIALIYKEDWSICLCTGLIKGSYVMKLTVDLGPNFFGNILGY